MKTIYVAEDGKQFEDGDECLDYEFQKNILDKLPSSSISFYDKNKNKMSYPKNYEDVEKIYCYSFYISIGDEKDAPLLAEINSYYGFFFPDEIGEWHFDEEILYWVKNSN